MKEKGGSYGWAVVFIVAVLAVVIIMWYSDQAAKQRAHTRDIFNLGIDTSLLTPIPIWTPEPTAPKVDVNITITFGD